MSEFSGLRGPKTEIDRALDGSDVHRVVLDGEGADILNQEFAAAGMSGFGPPIQADKSLHAKRRSSVFDVDVTDTATGRAVAAPAPLPSTAPALPPAFGVRPAGPAAPAPVTPAPASPLPAVTDPWPATTAAIMAQTARMDPLNDASVNPAKRSLAEWEKLKRDAVLRCGRRSLATVIASFTEIEFLSFSKMVKDIDLMDSFDGTGTGAIKLKGWPLMPIGPQKELVRIDLAEAPTENQLNLADELKDLTLAGHSPVYVEQFARIAIVASALISFAGRPTVIMSGTPSRSEKDEIPMATLKKARFMVSRNLGISIARQIYDTYNLFMAAIDFILCDLETLKKN